MQQSRCQWCGHGHGHPAVACGNASGQCAARQLSACALRDRDFQKSKMFNLTWRIQQQAALKSSSFSDIVVSTLERRWIGADHGPWLCYSIMVTSQWRLWEYWMSSRRPSSWGPSHVERHCLDPLNLIIAFARLPLDELDSAWVGLALPVKGKRQIQKKINQRWIHTRLNIKRPTPRFLRVQIRRIWKYLNSSVIATCKKWHVLQRYAINANTCTMYWLYNVMACIVASIVACIGGITSMYSILTGMYKIYTCLFWYLYCVGITYVLNCNTC